MGQNVAVFRNNTISNNRMKMDKSLSSGRDYKSDSVWKVMTISAPRPDSKKSWARTSLNALFVAVTDFITTWVSHHQPLLEL
jgi:hypothetical protein